MVEVSVTAADIATGEPENCYACPVALALVRTTGDASANVFRRDWVLRVEVWGRSIVAPAEVRDFVCSFDGYQGFQDVRPFAFSLPDDDSPEWKEQCQGCEGLFRCDELDDDGVCPNCLAEEED